MKKWARLIFNRRGMLVSVPATSFAVLGFMSGLHVPFWSLTTIALIVSFPWNWIAAIALGVASAPIVFVLAVYIEYEVPLFNWALLLFYGGIAIGAQINGTLLFDKLQKKPK